MTVVSDTSPLCYLLLIEAIDILPALYAHVVIPTRVRAELASPQAPAAVQTWISKPPDWLTVQTIDAEFDSAAENIDQEEYEAIMLALSIDADLILLDDLAGRRAARERGLEAIGLIGVLQLAAKRGLVDITVAIEKLRLTNFRISERLLERLLKDAM